MATATFALQLLEQAADAPTIQDAEKPAHEKALYELGRQLLARNRIPDAEARFRKMLQLYPKAADAPTAKLCLASALLAQVERSPAGASDPRLTESLALLESEADSPDKALQTQAKLRVARAYLGVGKYEDAVKTATNLADATKGTVEELIALSMAYNAYAYQSQWDQAGVIASRMRGTFKDLPETSFAGDTPEYTRNYWSQNWFEKLDKVKPANDAIRPVENRQP
jgi:tetratricopeptide (TPR) repeat protein